MNCRFSGDSLDRAKMNESVDARRRGPADPFARSLDIRLLKLRNGVSIWPGYMLLHFEMDDAFDTVNCSSIGQDLRPP